MAMNPDSDPTRHSAGSPGGERLDAATALIQHHTDERWVEIEDAMLQRVLAVSRPSHPVRGATHDAVFHVSEQVLTAAILSATDTVAACNVNAIRIHTEGDVCVGITVVVTGQYGYSLIAVADRVRDAAQGVLPTVLGETVPPVTVTDMRVHFDEVTATDPKLG